jgi:hypothetical protein
MRKTTGARLRGVMGRWSVFRDKVNDTEHRVQGILSDIGRQSFERQREALARLYKAVMHRDPTTVSDADTIEFLARGELDTRAYLKKLRDLEVRVARSEEALGEFLRK